MRQQIMNNPWQVGGAGGGVPVATGNLRDAHLYKQKPFELIIEPTRNYANFVHEGTVHMEARPWLEYAITTKEKDVMAEAQIMIDDVVNDIGKNI